MEVIGVLVVFASCLMALTHSSFWQFQRMVKHITGRSAFFSYYGYGCYCGLGGKGTPVDDTDRCCLAHDCCYEKLKQLGCQPVLNSYQFHIANGTVVCECALGPGAGCLCGLRACECDKRSAYCFKDSLPTYEKNFKQFSSRPRCGRRKLQCCGAPGSPCRSAPAPESSRKPLTSSPQAPVLAAHASASALGHSSVPRHRGTGDQPWKRQSPGLLWRETDHKYTHK